MTHYLAPRFCLPLSWLGVFVACMLAALPGVAAGEGKSGEEIYRMQCAKCHGAKGEGNDDHYPHPLIGDRSLQELTQYVDKSMPEEDPKACVGEEAVAVSKYVFDSFYSRVAQARNRPVRIELSRLTVRQYRQSVADLFTPGGEPTRWETARGLKGEYFKSRRFNRREREIERVDGQVSFQFGEGSPEKGKFDDAEFAIRWQGSVIAPETGEYEFNLKTENGARLWVNNTQVPLVDVWVRSGTELDHKASVFLLGGRAYPLKLEMFKSKEAKEKTASVSLEWKLARRPAELVPERFLLPDTVPATYVVSTAFPPDDRSVGYERGTSISKEWDKAATDAAVDAATFVAQRVNELAGTRTEAADRRAKIQEYCRQLAERAFRRPLTPEQQEFFITRQFAADTPVEVGAKRSVLLVLKSPRFLYRELSEQPDAYVVASRLAFGLWDSLPDQPLLDAARKGQLKTPDQVAAQAKRMLTDRRAESKLKEFLLQWLKVDQVPDIAKDPQLFPEFTPQVAADLRTSLDLFLTEVVTSEQADFRQFLVSDSLFLNGRLSQLYGGDLPADAPFQQVTLEPHERAGILSHPYLMAGFAYTATSSPIHRGVFLARSVLGRALRVPPEAVAPLVADLHPNLTTRERVALQTKPEVCQTCHAMLNPLGFTLENFDALGRFREQEKGRPVDATGMYQTRDGEIVKFTGVRELATFLAASPETHAAFTEQLFHYLVKQPIRAYGTEQMSELRAAFQKHDFNVRDLMVEIMVTACLKSP